MSHTEQTCVWCGLPLPKRWWTVQTDDVRSLSEKTQESDDYCCFGCRFAADVTADRGEAGQVRWTLTRLGIAIFFAMNVSMFTMALWSHDVYEIDPSDTLAASLTDLFVWLSFFCALPVLFLLGAPIAVSACRALQSGRVTTDLLVFGGVLTAFAYSVVSMLTGSSHIYFEVASLVLVLITLGRWIEANGKLQTNEVLESLERLLPETARRLVNAPDSFSQAADSESEVPTSTLKPGDRIRILPGERIPADGLVENQAASIDEQMLTGESRPVVKQPGDSVFSGTLNIDADLVVRVSRAINESTVARLVRAVREARQSRGYYQRLADRVTTRFVPFVGIVMCATITLHLISHSIPDAILAGFAVVLIACPCALGLATSVAVWTALGRAAERGILIRNGEVLERLAHLKAIRFDKTGTLTTGEARVTSVLCPIGEDGSEVLRIAASLAKRSSHSFSRAIVTHARERYRPVDLFKINDLRAVAGKGLMGFMTAGDSVLLGSRDFLMERGCKFDSTFERFVNLHLTYGPATVFVGRNRDVCGVVLLDEALRPEVSSALAECRRLGLDLAILSGDRPERAAKFAQESGLACKAGLLPKLKLAALREARELCGPVMMVGDGINDAPSLAAADVGVALGCGTDVSRDAAGVCLLSNDLSAIPWVCELGRLTRRVILQNLAWAFGYNTIGMTLAAFGLLNPVIAAIVMFVSSMVVLANSRRLKFFDYEHGHQILDEAATSDALQVATESIGSAFNDESTDWSVPSPQGSLAGILKSRTHSETDRGTRSKVGAES